MVLLCTDMDLNFEEIKGFEWDNGNLGHIKKHKVEYLECEEIFENKPLLMRKDTGHSEMETRFRIMGKTDAGRKIFLICTIRKGKIRAISARDQNKKERRDYEEIKENSQI